MKKYLFKARWSAVQWLMRLVAGRSPRRPGFDPGSLDVGFVVDKNGAGTGFFLDYFAFPPVFHYAENRKKRIIIFITRLHNKPQGCVASVASAAGPFTIYPLKTKFVRFI
jgi:hypothetical protein